MTRTFNFDAYAGKTICGMGVMNESTSGLGSWDIRASEIAMTNTDGSTVTFFGHEPSVSFTVGYAYGGITAVAVENERGDPGAEAQLPLTTTAYYVGDHLGTATAEYTGAGWPLWSGNFAPFGQELRPQPTSNPYKFTGQERDAESGLDHFQYRSLSSTMGRWMSPDPYLGSYDLTNPQSFNRYAYVLNNPLRFTDPMGLNKAPCEPVYNVDEMIYYLDCQGQIPQGGDNSVTVYGGGDNWFTSHCGTDCDVAVGISDGGVSDIGGGTASQINRILQCASKTANNYSIAGVLGIDQDKHPVLANLSGAFLGNTFSGMVDIGTHFYNGLHGQPQDAVLGVTDALMGGARQGFPGEK